MKKSVKNFGQFVNEARFYHALPQGETRLRDQYRELSTGEQDEIQDMAKELEEFNLLSKFKKGLSKYEKIAQIKNDMKEAIESAREFDKYQKLSAKEKAEYQASHTGWSVRRPR